MGVIFKNDILFSGGSGDNSRELTYEEYMALSEEEKKNGTTYYVPDAKSTNVSAILNTKAEIEANTEENKIAGALAVKEVIEEVNSNLASVIPDTSTDTVVSLFNAMPKNSTRRYFCSGGLSDFPDSEKSAGFHLLEIYKANTAEGSYSRILLINNSTGNLYSGRCDGTTVVWNKYVLSSELEYKDISDKFTADESKIKILSAYVENGTVFINVRVLVGVTGTVSAQLNDLTYAPRVIAAGVYMSMSSSADKGKFVGGNVSKEGVLTLWFDSALSYAENVVFTYPLKK